MEVLGETLGLVVITLSHSCDSAPLPQGQLGGGGTLQTRQAMLCLSVKLRWIVRQEPVLRPLLAARPIITLHHVVTLLLLQSQKIQEVVQVKRISLSKLVQDKPVSLEFRAK